MVGGRKLKILPRAPSKPVPALRSRDLKLSITKLSLKARFPPSLHIDLQSHASERAPSELTSDTMRDGVGGGLNAMLPDYLTSHSPVRKYYSNSTFHSHWNVLIIMSGWTGCTAVCKCIFWKAGRTAYRNVRTEHFDWTNILWSYAFHKPYNYI